jgi:hypothetical protein
MDRPNPKKRKFYDMKNNIVVGAPDFKVPDFKVMIPRSYFDFIQRLSAFEGGKSFVDECQSAFQFAIERTVDTLRANTIDRHKQSKRGIAFGLKTELAMEAHTVYFTGQGGLFANTPEPYVLPMYKGDSSYNWKTGHIETQFTLNSLTQFKINDKDMGCQVILQGTDTDIHSPSPCSILKRVVLLMYGTTLESMSHVLTQPLLCSEFVLSCLIS